MAIPSIGISLFSSCRGATPTPATIPKGDIMSAARRVEQTPDLSVLPPQEKKKGRPVTMAARDQKIIEKLIRAKQTREEIAKEFGITPQYVSQIANTPAALAVLAGKAGNAKAMNYARVQAMIGRRLELIARSGDLIDLEVLIKLANALAPKHEHSPDAYEFLHAEAERIADEYNLTGDKRARFLSLVRENAA